MFNWLKKEQFSEEKIRLIRSIAPSQILVWKINVLFKEKPDHTVNTSFEHIFKGMEDNRMKNRCQDFLVGR